MKNRWNAKRKMLAAIGGAGLLILAAILFFTAPRGEKIPALRLPEGGEAGAAHTQVRLLDSIEPDVNGLSQTLSVYRLKPVDVEQEKKKIQSLFGVSSADIGAYPTGRTLADGTSIGIDGKTGRWFYRQPINFDAKGGALSDQDAVRIAEDFIADNDLYPPDSLGAGKIGTTATGDASQGTEKILQKTVYYYPLVAGKPVFGTFRICISVSSDGNVVGVDKLANAYERVDTAIAGKRFPDVASALDQNNYVLNAEAAPDSLVIDSIYDALYADPESAYIQPIYVLKGMDESTSEEHSIWMDARTN